MVVGIQVGSQDSPKPTTRQNWLDGQAGVSISNVESYDTYSEILIPCAWEGGGSLNNLNN